MVEHIPEEDGVGGSIPPLGTRKKITINFLMKNFKAIGFDYGGVIAGISGPEFNRRISILLGIEQKTFQDVYFKFNYLLNNNILSRQEFWKKIAEELGVPEKYNNVIKFIEALPHHELNEQVINLVGRLRINGYKVGLLSNNDIETANKFKENGLSEHFDAVVVSAEVGYSKPHFKAFEILTERLGVKAKELIYIDDSEKSLINAEEIGFQPILFSDYESLLLNLRSLGIKI